MIFRPMLLGSTALAVVLSGAALAMPQVPIIPLDMAPGQYRFGPGEDGAWFESDGKVGFVPGSGLASSVVALDTMVRNMKAMTAAPLHDVVRMASLTPAERAGVADEVGSIEVGKRAYLLLLDRRLKVRRVFVDGMEA